MLKLQPNPTFKVKVNISTPGVAVGPAVEVEFKWLDRDAIKAYFDGLSGKTDVESLGEIVVGWSGVDAPYDAGALALLLGRYPAAATDLFEAFRRELLEAKRKN